MAILRIRLSLDVLIVGVSKVCHTRRFMFEGDADDLSGAVVTVADGGLLFARFVSFAIS